MRRTQNAIALIILMLSVRTVSAVVPPGYSMTTTTKIFQGDPAVLVDQDSQTGVLPVSASSSGTAGGTTATAESSAGVNFLQVRSVATAGDINSPWFTATSQAIWNDRLFFERNGVPVTSGTIAYTFHTKGFIDFQPSFPTQFLVVSVNGSGIGLGFNGTYDQSFTTTILNNSWNAVDGFALNFMMNANASKDYRTVSATNDFYAGTRITNIALIGPNGLPDPTVKITSASGTSYTIPEPSGALLVGVFVNLAAFARRPRRK